MATISPWPKNQYFDNNGDLANGAKLFIYEAGTTTKATTYTSEDESSANTNPIILDSRGEANVWLPTGSFKFVLAPSTDTDPPTSPYWTVDDIEGSGGQNASASSISDLKALSPGAVEIVTVKGYYTENDEGGGTFFWNETSTAADDGGIIITPSSSPAVGRWERLTGDVVKPRWWGAKGDGTTDDTTAFTNMLAYISTNGTINITRGTYLLTSNKTIPAGVNTIFNEGGQINGATTFTINGDFDAPLSRIAIGTTTLAFGNEGNKDFYPQWWGVVGDGATDDYTAIVAAATAVNSLTFGANLIFPRGIYEILTNLTFASNTNVIMQKGALFSSSGTNTITFNGPFEAGLSQTFAASLGTVTFGDISGVVAIPQWWGAQGDLTTVATNNTDAIQKCFNSSLFVRIPPGFYSTNSVNIPATVREATCEGTLGARSNSITVVTVSPDVTRDYPKVIRGFRIGANSKTGITGMKIGTTTALLYLRMSDCIVFDCVTGIESLVSQEHHYDNVIVEGNTTGFKFYSDSTNGGATASFFSSCRFQGNTVGLIIKNNFAAQAVPVHNNSFDGATFQENTVCGVVVYGSAGIGFRSAHFENNGGTSSTTIDSLVISECDMQVEKSTVSITDTDNASSLDPCFIVKDNSSLSVHNLTGYGTIAGALYQTDETSQVVEGGNVRGLGRKTQINGYGTLQSVSRSQVMGYPKVSYEIFENIYPNDPLLPDLTNRTGTTSEQLANTEMGLTNSVTFAGSAGSTSTNRVYMIPNATSGNAMISSFLMRTDQASTGVTVNWFTGGTSRSSETYTLDDQWRRFVWVTSSETNHEVYIFPSGSDAATVYIKGVHAYSGDLQEVARQYQQGTIGVNRIIANRASAAPTVGTWVVGDVVWDDTPSASGFMGWVCTTAGTPGTWKTFGAISA